MSSLKIYWSYILADARGQALNLGPGLGWMQIYDGRTARFRVDAARLDLAREFRRNVRGPHSDELRRVLHRMRAGPLEGKYLLICLEPRRKWMLASLRSRGKPLKRLENRVFTSLEEAEWEVFKLRWKDLTGGDLDLD